MDWYTSEYGDVMMRHSPAWFQSFIFSEMFMQFPFFFVGFYAYWKGRSTRGVVDILVCWTCFELHVQHGEWLNDYMHQAFLHLKQYLAWSICADAFAFCDNAWQQTRFFGLIVLYDASTIDIIYYEFAGLNILTVGHEPSFKFRWTLLSYLCWKETPKRPTAVMVNPVCIFSKVWNNSFVYLKNCHVTILPFALNVKINSHSTELCGLNNLFQVFQSVAGYDFRW